MRCTRAASRPSRLGRARDAREQFVDWVSGACLLVRRADAEAVGPARRALLPLHRGRRLLRAVRARGRRVLFTPAAEIVHLRGRSRATAADAMNAGLPPQPPRVLREAPSAVGAAAAALPAAEGHLTQLRRGSRDKMRVIVRIAIDARKLRDYGIGTYVRNLLRHLARLDHDDRVRPALPRRGLRRGRRSSGANFRAVAETRRRLFGRASSCACPLDLRREGADLFHAPHYVLPPLDAVPVGRDDSRLHPPAVSAVPAEPARLRVRARVDVGRDAPGEPRPDGLGGSKRDILRVLPRPRVEDRRHLQRHRRALRRSRRPRTRSSACASAISSNDPFVLYAGNIKPHKNLERLIEAFHLLRQRRGFEHVKLLIIGDEISKYATLRRAVHRYKLHKHVRFLGFVPDETLAVLYRLAARLRVPVALRRLRAAAARGDGQRHAGRSPRTSRRCRKSSATRRC